METKDYVENRNVLKEDFGWEVPVELVPLPSKGVLYHPETPLYKKEGLKIKAMTAREEDILSSQALIKEGTVLDHLIDSCLVERGVDSKLLTIGDRNALMISIRITGYGPDYHVTTNCTGCGHSNDVTIDLGSLAIKRLSIDPVAPGENLFEFELPVTKKKVHFKYTTMKDEREYSSRSNQMKKHLKDFFETNVTDSLDMAIQSVDGITDKNKIKHFILNMPAFDSRALRAHIKKNEPGMDMTWEFSCSKCQKENKIAMPITSEFFGPVHNWKELFLEEAFALQMHLNMSYQDIKNLPVRYRRWFIDRLKKHYDKKSEMYERSTTSKQNDSDFSNLSKFEENMSKKFTS